jgi:hypothetical protein
VQANGSHEKIFLHMESLRSFLEICNTPKLLIRKKEICKHLTLNSRIVVVPIGMLTC